jgi:hypothetical protein
LERNFSLLKTKGPDKSGLVQLWNFNSQAHEIPASLNMEQIVGSREHKEESREQKSTINVVAQNLEP